MRILFLFIFFTQNLFSQELNTLSYNPVDQGSIGKIYDFPSNYVDSRPIYVWLPPNFNPEEKHNLLIMNDGQNLFDGTKTWNGQEWKLDEWSAKLISENRVNSFIIVGIHNSGKNRWNDYFPENSYDFISDIKYLGKNKPHLNANLYLKYIVNEVIPYTSSKYLKYSKDFKIIIGGSSMGGLISMYAAFEYPEIFDGAICMSTHWPGAYVIDDNPLPDAIFNYMSKNIPISKNKRFYFDYGDKGLDKHYPQYSKTLDSIFTQNGYSNQNYRNMYFKNESHNEEAWSKRVNIPLKFIFN